MDAHVLTADQLRCLASPVRNDVFAALRSIRVGSTKEIAARMNRSPESIHYHVKALLACDLIQVKERRPAPKKPEAVYAPSHAKLRLPEGESERKLVAAVSEAGLRQSVRGFIKSNLEGRRPHLLRLSVRLSPKDESRFIAMLEEATRFADSHFAPDEEPSSWLSLFYSGPP